MRCAHRGGLLRLRPGATPLGGAAAAQGRLTTARSRVEIFRENGGWNGGFSGDLVAIYGDFVGFKMVENDGNEVEWDL